MKRSFRPPRARTAFAEPWTLAWPHDAVYPWNSGWSSDPIVRFRAQRLDPHRTSLLAILQRADVAAELRLSAGQRLAIDTALATAQCASDAEVEALLRAAGASAPVRRPRTVRGVRPGPQPARDPAPQIGIIRRLYNQRIYAQVNAILAGAQTERLAELDLQYRGGLALADEKVSDRIGLSGCERAVVEGAYHEYVAFMRAVWQALRPYQALPAAVPAVVMASDAAALAVAYDAEASRLRAGLGAKALACLAPSRRSAWEAAVGAPFDFAAARPGSVRFGRRAWAGR